MDPMVLLRHDTPDGGHHFDWMLSRPAGSNDIDRRLLTFRVGVRIDLESIESAALVRIGDHRRAYLDYEGELSAGRGSVSRVAAGRCTIRRESDVAIDIEADWGGGPRRWALRRDGGGDRWSARPVTPTPGDGR